LVTVYIALEESDEDPVLGVKAAIFIMASWAGSVWRRGMEEGEWIGRGWAAWMSLFI